ncbi:hypothetical protein OS493_004582 [Desmophyllum pertusum]|uniref:Uncharacterized protein n=1 Tax=Desmophyllum pertusum TaxID=174260 RepID=A0A9W9ZFW4_9CNID|nr:hypothetical protein OS493_004582 [Desmophyllum pertusum]
MDDCAYCCLLLFLVVASAIGAPGIYYGTQCRNDYLRAQWKNTDVCKIVDNDKLAEAFMGVGATFALFALVANGFAVKYFGDTSRSFKTCMCIAAFISLATGTPCLYYGLKCWNAELRAEHENGLCKDIHNDESAIALQAFGWILLIPWLVGLGIFLGKIYKILKIIRCMMGDWDDV